MAAIEFRALSIQGFRSFRRRQKLSLVQPDGLAYVTGRNLVNPKMGANAVGKSSLWEALIWVLYGKTSSGLKAGSIQSWSGKEQCRVVLSLTKDSRKYRLIRTWSPNALMLVDVASGQKTEMDQGRLDAFIGLSFDEFRHSVVLSQFGKMFLDLAPADKAELLSQVLQLTVWDGFSEKAALVSDEAEIELATLQEDEGRVSGQLDGLGISNLRAARDTWELTRKQQTEVAGSLVQDLEKQLEEVTASISVVQRRAGKLQRKQDKILKRVSRVQSKWSGLRDKIAQVSKLRARLDERRKSVEAALDALQSLDGKSGKCPACGQKVDAKHLVSESELQEASLASVTQEAAELEQREVALESSSVAAQERCRKLERVQSRVRGKLDDAKSTYAELIQKKKYVRQELYTKQTEAEKGATQKNPFAVLLKQAEGKAAKLQMRLAEIESGKKKWNARKSSGDFWVKEFRNIKLFILETVFQHLEVEVNDVLTRLGLEGWALKFNTDKVSASGNVRKMFSTEVYVPGRKSAIPWEVWSGGESQRLRLAAQLGLSNMILHRKGIQTNLQVLDEPTSWLSVEGVESLLDTLAVWAESNGKTVWLLDHRVLGRGGFSSKWSITLTDAGSVVERVD